MPDFDLTFRTLYFSPVITDDYYREEFIFHGAEGVTSSDTKNDSVYQEAALGKKGRISEIERRVRKK